VIEESVAKAYFGIVSLHLGIPRTRHWWSTIGRVGFNPEFVADVDQFIVGRPPTTYFEDLISFDAPPATARGDLNLTDRTIPSRSGAA